MKQAIILLLFSSVITFSSAAQEACPGNADPRLEIGELAQVTPGDANNVRSEPQASSDLVGKIPGSDVFKVLDGPECGDGYTWWRVEYLDFRGWTPEGSGDDYWIQPYTQPEPVSVGVLSDDETTFSIDHVGIHFLVDASLASDVQYEPIPTVYYEMGGGAPAHHQFTFLQTTDNDASEPSTVLEIGIYPFERLVGQVVEGYENETALLNLLEEQPAIVDDDIPTMIRYGAAQMLRSQVKYLHFDGGRGVRFVTFYAQDLLFADNDRLRFMFVGLTDDNSTFILIDLPLNASILPDEANYNDYNPDTHEANYPTYLAETNAALNALPASEYTPNLALMDALIESLMIEE